MADNDSITFPDPKTEIGVLRRYLHVLALLQANHSPGGGKGDADNEKWNAANLADLLSLEDDESPVSDKSVRDYINKNLVDELGITVTKVQGGRSTEIKGPLDEEVLARVANIYATFVVQDSSREIILKYLIREHPGDCLWLLARCHFAILERRGIEIDYINNSGEKREKLKVFPWHLVIRNNNLYLVAHRIGHEAPWLFIVNRIRKLRVIREEFKGTVPPVDEIFPDTLGGFIGTKYRVLIRFDEGNLPKIEQILSILKPEEKRLEKGRYEMRFTVADGQYLCKQLFAFGNGVEIVEPPELRKMMVDMLHESLRAYEF